MSDAPQKWLAGLLLQLSIILNIKVSIVRTVFVVLALIGPTKMFVIGYGLVAAYQYLAKQLRKQE